MCDKSRNTWLCVHWQWNTLEWCQLNALQASPVVHLMTPLSCFSLSMNTQPSVPTIGLPFCGTVCARFDQRGNTCFWRYVQTFSFKLKSWLVSNLAIMENIEFNVKSEYIFIFKSLANVSPWFTGDIGVTLAIPHQASAACLNYNGNG